jgi:putative cardiolipin synthase
MNPRPMLAVSMIVWAAALLAGCAGQPIEPYARPAPQFAPAPRADGAFAGVEAQVRAASGAEASGFALIDSNEEALRWRLALIDSARHTIDLQYYIWFADSAGRLLLKRVLDAADRGVKVRILVDDLNTVLEDAGTVKQRDGAAAWIDSHPNVELRLFNPWRERSLGGRVGESVAETARVNQRMHNKALVVDNQATIIGGRNIGDEYMGLATEFNFHDLDVIGVGPVARQVSAVFDLFWNSDWVMPASALRVRIDPVRAAAGRARLDQRVAADPMLVRFHPAPSSWSTDIEALGRRLEPGHSTVETDRPLDGRIAQDMIRVIYRELLPLQRELLVVNAYVIPDAHALQTLRDLRRRGVQVSILTNSLASHDVPAVNSHYRAWRKPLVEAGVALYEIRHDAAIRGEVADTAPIRSTFMGLHSKAMVLDRSRCIVGSMNLDPRSAAVNTEMGVIIRSIGLCGDLAKRIERDTRPENAWRVELAPDGGLRWVNDRQTVARQPARNAWQRVLDVFFVAFPKEYY